MEGLDTRRSRRSVLQGASYGLATLAGLLTGRTRAQSSDAASKMSKMRAEYQDMPNGIFSCATCTLFVPPAACKVVEGEISPDGWCRAFALAD
jgi:hypothetical protein